MKTQHLATQCTCVFRMDLTVPNEYSLCIFNRLVFVIDMWCFFDEEETEFLSII